MAKAKFENGQFVNPETGLPIGKQYGNTTMINSRESDEVFSLEDYGVDIPEFPDEDRPKKKRKEEDGDFANAGNTSFNPSDNVPVNPSKDSMPVQHFDVQPTSFKRKKSKYEVTDKSYFTVRFGLYEKEEGHFVPIKEEAIETIPEAEPHWVKFRMWTYPEELRWKSECLEYNNATKSQFLNIDRLNERKIKFLMKDWSFGEYDDGLKLLHCDGRLSDESYAKFMGIYPSIANTIVELMNLVLESNQ